MGRFNTLSYKSIYIPNLFSLRLQRTGVYRMDRTALDRTALPLSLSLAQVFWNRGEHSCLSLCTIRVYIYRLITYQGILETRLLISRLSTSLPPTDSISLLRSSLMKISLFFQWGYFTGRLHSLSVSTPDSSWSGMFSLVFVLHVPESFGTHRRDVSIQLWRPWFCLFSDELCSL